MKAKIQRERNSLQPQDRLKLEHDARKLENDARTTLVQTFGGLALFLGIYWSAKTWWITREGQVTDRFTKAINQLGETGPPKLAIRLGGIYALERVARDSARDHWPIMEILTAYVREHAPWKEEKQLSQEEISLSETQPTQNNQSSPKPAADIQAILTVVGRRTHTYGKGEVQQLDLGNTDLRGVWLPRAHLEGAFLVEAHLERADLTRAHLERADLSETHLEGALLWQARLEGAILAEAHLEGARLGGAHLDGAFLVEAHLKRADLAGAELKRALLSRAHLEGALLWQARLRGAKSLTVEQLSTVKTLAQFIAVCRKSK